MFVNEKYKILFFLDFVFYFIYTHNIVILYNIFNKLNNLLFSNQNRHHPYSVHCILYIYTMQALYMQCSSTVQASRMRHQGTVQAPSCSVQALTVSSCMALPVTAAFAFSLSSSSLAPRA